MAISVDCQNCGKTLKAKDSAAGKTAKCPGCGEPIQIPAISEVYDAEDEFGSAAGTGADLPASSGGDQKPCPMCGEMIAAAAKKCRYCGEIFDAALKKKKKKQSSFSASDGDAMGPVEWVACLLCPGLACIAGIVYTIQGKSNGPKMIGISLCAMAVYAVIRVLAETAVQR